MEGVTIIDADASTVENYPMCGYKNKKHVGYQRKLQWLKDRFAEGMRYKILYSETAGAVGGIEYIPAEFAWRPVLAEGYMFVHCVYIMLKDFKEKGYGSMLLEACLEDARQQGKKGVAVVSRKGTWMAKRELFIKHGFQTADKAPPDFELLVKTFSDDAGSPSPSFCVDWEKRLAQMGDGLTIVISGQCPYASKAVNEIRETAEKEYGITPKMVELKTHLDARESPCAFGTFCMVYDGKLVAEHPISKGRFRNIMKKVL